MKANVNQSRSMSTPETWLASKTNKMEKLKRKQGSARTKKKIDFDPKFATRFADHVTKRNKHPGNENDQNSVCCCLKKFCILNFVTRLTRGYVRYDFSRPYRVTIALCFTKMRIAIISC